MRSNISNGNRAGNGEFTINRGTIHSSAILPTPDDLREKAYRDFVADLALIAKEDAKNPHRSELKKGKSA